MNLHNFSSGSRITGLYYGVFFSGVVHTAHNPIITVVLDRPIHLFGTDRYYIKFNIPWQGEIYGVDLWSIQQGKSFHMADRFESVECSPVFAVKLYREMERQSADRIETMLELGIATIKRLDEIRMMRACYILIRRYAELIP